MRVKKRFSEQVSRFLRHQFEQPVFSLQMDSVLYAEFLLWKEKPSLDHSSAFLSRIYREDVGPCLSFTRSEVTVLPCWDPGGSCPSSLITSLLCPAAVAARAERRGEQLPDHRACGRLSSTHAQSLGGGVQRAQVSMSFPHQVMVLALSQLGAGRLSLLLEEGGSGAKGCSLWGLLITPV